MYKSRLQELCQKRSWGLPEYKTTKQGLDHNPSFFATVLVNGQSFHTQNTSKSSKEAQNEVAKLAFHYFSPPEPQPQPEAQAQAQAQPQLPPQPQPDSRLPIPPASSFPQPSPPASSVSSGAISEVDTIRATGETLQQNIQGTCQTPQAGDDTSSVSLQVSGSTTVVEEGYKFRDVQHFYKSELQTYAQKRNLGFPVYSCEREGPPHASRFRSRVTFDGKTYESSEFFPTLKDAEHAAARVALMSLSPDRVQMDDFGLYKNLLQELLQKKGLHLPTYNISSSGESHCPVFISTVEIEGEHFTGEEAKTKKQAEMSAAKVAYNTLKKRKLGEVPLIPPPSQQPQETPELSSSCLQQNIFANSQHVRPNVPVNSSPSIIPMQQAEDHTGKGVSSSSGILYGGAQDTSPSAPYESTSSSLSATISSSFTNSVEDSSLGPSSGSSSSCKKVTIYPANKPVPAGSTLLPMCDENWVAFSPPEAKSKSKNYSKGVGERAQEELN